MEIINAKDLVPISKEQIVDLFCEDLMHTISEYRENRRVCFHAYVYKAKDGKYYPGYKYWKLPRELKRGGGDYSGYVPFDDYKDEVRRKFRSAGYTVQPTGYIGGVWQDTESIIW